MSVLPLISGFSIALILSICLTPLVGKLSCVYGLYDNPTLNTSPNRMRMHSNPTPRLGGIAIVLAFFFTYMLTLKNFVPPYPLLLSLPIFLIGGVDDIYAISAKFRFALQILFSLIVVYVGGLDITELHFWGNVSVTLPFWAGSILSTFIIVGAINSLNMIDGLDGLAGGTSIISLAMLALLYYLTTHDTRLMVYVSIPVIGAIFGFLRYNTHPASIFMGDNGSNWLGFVIGLHILFVVKAQSLSWLGVSSTDIVHFQKVPLLSALLCFAVPILDTAYVITQRLFAGEHPMQADNKHLHHKLLRLGLNQTQTVLLIYFVSLATSILGILPLAYTNYNFAWTPYLGLFCICTVLFMSTHVKWRQTYKNPLRNLLVSKNSAKNGYSILVNRAIRYWEKANKYCIFAIVAVTPIFAGPMPESLGYAAIPLLVLIALSTFLPRNKSDFIETLVLTVSCILLLISNNHSSIQVEILGAPYNIQGLYNSLFVFLFFSSLLFFFLTIKRNYLVLTASDFLLLILPIILLLFPDPMKQEFRLDIISLRSFILFLGYKALEKRKIYARRHLAMATFLALAYIVMVSVFKMRIVY